MYIPSSNGVTPAADGNLNFRKSLYDDKGDAPTLDSILVARRVDQNGQLNETTYADEEWFSVTTSTEHTTEGPNSDRDYLHIDFTVDSDRNSVSTGTPVQYGGTWEFQVVATDSGGTQHTFTFPWTNGTIDFSSIPGYKSHIAARELDGYNDGDSVTSITDLADDSITWNPVGTANYESSHTITSTPTLTGPLNRSFLFPDSTNTTSAFSIFIVGVFNHAAHSITPIIKQGDAELRPRTLNYHWAATFDSITVETTVSPGTYHYRSRIGELYRRSDGHVDIVFPENTATGQSTITFTNDDFILDMRTLQEFIYFDSYIEDQNLRQQIRRSLYNLTNVELAYDISTDH